MELRRDVVAEEGTEEHHGGCRGDDGLEFGSHHWTGPGCLQRTGKKSDQFM